MHSFCPGPRTPSRKPRFDVPQGACDSHAHLFGPARLYPYAEPRSYTPPDADAEDYVALLGWLDLDRAVIVQPSVYGTDNRRTRDAVAASGGRWRGVAVIEPAISDRELDELHASGMRGARINIKTNIGVKLEDDLEAIAKRVQRLGWHVQIFVDARELKAMAPRLRALPVDFVIDHMGHMPPQTPVADPGFQELLAMLRERRCWVKLSGAYRFSEMPPPYRDVMPFVDAMVDAAADRLVWASNWPHPWAHPVAPPDGYTPDDTDLLDALADWIPDADMRRKILVDNPAALYGF